MSITREGKKSRKSPWVMVSLYDAELLLHHDHIPRVWPTGLNQILANKRESQLVPSGAHFCKRERVGWEGLEERRGGKGGKKEGRVFSGLPLEFSGSGGQDAYESCRSQGNEGCCVYHVCSGMGIICGSRRPQ